MWSSRYSRDRSKRVGCRISWSSLHIWATPSPGVGRRDVAHSSWCSQGKPSGNLQWGSRSPLSTLSRIYRPLPTPFPDHRSCNPNRECGTYRIFLPGPTIKQTASSALVDATPLFEKERHVLILAGSPDILDPLTCHRARSWTTFATDDGPMDAC